MSAEPNVPYPNKQICFMYLSQSKNTKNAY